MREHVYKPDLEPHLNEYLDTCSSEITDSQFEQINKHANEAFQEVTPETVGMIPIAAAQEPPEHIQSSLEQLARQRNDPEAHPFSVVLSANYPSVNNSEYERNRERTREAIYDFQHSKQGHHLPLSFYEQTYTPETTIGAIRRDLGIVSLKYLHQQYNGIPMPRHLGMLIFDVDTIKLSPKFMSRQQHMLREGYSWTCANVRYPTTNGKFPNLDRSIHALNLAQALSPRGSYDAYSMYRAETLIAGDIFDGQDSIAETHEMRARAAEVMGNAFIEPEFRQVNGAYAVTSSRRIMDKYRRGQPPYEFWRKQEFDMQDKYREGIAFRADEDISDGLANYYVGSCIGTITGHIRDQHISMLHNEHGDLTYAQVRTAVDEHINRLLEVADLRLNLQLGRLSVFDIVRRPTVELEY